MRITIYKTCKSATAILTRHSIAYTKGKERNSRKEKRNNELFFVLYPRPRFAR